MLRIDEWLFRWFKDYKTYGNPRSDWRVNCPFCWERVGKTDTSHHLHVSIGKQACHCFRCDYSASWIRLVMDATGLPYTQALGELYVVPNPKRFDQLDSMLARRLQERRERPLERFTALPDGYLPLWEGDGREHKPLLDMVRAYMQRRGFSADVWERYALGYVPEIGPRVFIPVEGDYWQARAIFPFDNPKYIGPSTPSANVLGNSIALELYDEVVITEGVFSGISIGPNHVSLVGKNPTPQKVSRLAQCGVEHFIITVEPEAMEKMMTLADQLVAAGKRVTLWVYEEGDPADSQPVSKDAYNFHTKLSLLLQ